MSDISNIKELLEFAIRHIEDNIYESEIAVSVAHKRLIEVMK